MLRVDPLIDTGCRGVAEFGYAFNRRIEYESTDTKSDLSDGI